MFPRVYLKPEVEWQRISRNGFEGSVVNVGQLKVNDYNVLLSFEYDLDYLGKTAKNIKEKRLIKKAKEFLYESAALSLESEIARQYFYIQELDEKERILADTVKLREQLLVLTRQQFEAGVINEITGEGYSFIGVGIDPSTHTNIYQIHK